MSEHQPCSRILKRYKGNPIITPRDLPGAGAIYNCGATMFRGKYLLLLSTYDCNTIASMHVATSEDGASFKIREKSFIETSTDPEFKEYDGWTIDPRITKIGDVYYIVYPAYSRNGVVGMLGKTIDFEKFERIDIISLPDNRCPVLFPEKINGRYVRLDRPVGQVRPGQIWISYSPDLVHWGHHRLLMDFGRDVWNKLKIGPCAPPIKTEKGWLMIYHGVCEWGSIYSLGCALLDLENPAKIIGMAPGYILTPEEPYEISGRVSNVVFSAGAVVDEKTGELKIYYGAADTCIGLATAPLMELVEACL
ncbi:MAG: glycoside hydrolase family 130 protein [Candidatus Omnitrophica bacterium]|nr:glycoside hydrolase family 130 protein [Candidatus Omnitrophota bacterium]